MPCSDDLGTTFAWLLEGLGEDEARALDAALVPQDIRAGEVLFDAGQESDAMWLVASGALDVEMDTPHGVLRLGRVEAGGMLGETDLVSPRVTPVRAVARQDASLCRLDRPAFLSLRRTAPEAVGRLVSGICCDVARRIRKASVGLEPAPTGRGFDYRPALEALRGVQRRFVALDWSPGGPAVSTSNEGLLLDLHNAGVFDRVRENDPDLADGLEADLEMLAPGMGCQEHPPGDTVIAQGARADGVYVVLQGRVRVTIGSDRDWFHVDTTLGPGETFGEIAFFDDGTRSANVRTVEPTRLAVLYPATLRFLLASGERGHRVPLDLMEWFARQLVSDSRRLDELIRRRMGEDVRGEGAV